MRAAVIVVFLVCCCIGNSDQPQQCEKPVIDEHVSVSPDHVSVIFNGVYYRQTGEYQNSVSLLIKREIGSWEVYTDTETRNPDTLVVKDSTFFHYKKDNNGFFEGI